MIIIGYPGIGKSTLAESFNPAKYHNPPKSIIDLDSSVFNHTSEPNKNMIVINLYGKSDEWAERYCKVAELLSDQEHLVFVSSHAAVQKRLREYVGPVGVICPSLKLKMDYEANVDPDDKTLLHCYMKNLDTDSFPGATVLKKYCGVIKKFEEFYIYTGEGNFVEEEEINPVELVKVSLTNNDGKFITFDEGCLGNIWDEELRPRPEELDSCAYCDGVYPNSEFDVIHDDGLNAEVKICQECLRDLTSLRATVQNENMPSDNTCVCCGEVIPEGTQVCYKCVKNAMEPIPELSINWNERDSHKQESKDAPVDIHKIIDDAMEKRDRSVYILIHGDSTSVSINPYEDEKVYWIYREDTDKYHFECSNCGVDNEFHTAYCPSCGEQVHGVKEDES